MAPLPENNTARYFVDYTFSGQAHTMLFRGTAGTTAATLLTYAQSVINTMGPLLATGWTVSGARYSAAGSNFTLPVTAPNQPSTSITPMNNVLIPKYISFVGRGITTGRRVRLFLYGSPVQVPADYRFNPGEDERVDNVIGILNGAGANVGVTIAGDKVTWSQYGNTGFNSYWQRNARG